jgi:ribosomal protein L37E
MTMFQNLHRSLAASQTLKIECAGCGRRSTWTRAQAVAKLGPDATPVDIRRRLSCSACGSGGRARIWI